jgi:hypothetical protein
MHVSCQQRQISMAKVVTLASTLSSRLQHENGMANLDVSRSFYFHSMAVVSQTFSLKAYYFCTLPTVTSVLSLVWRGGKPNFVYHSVCPLSVLAAVACVPITVCVVKSDAVLYVPIIVCVVKSDALLYESDNIMDCVKGTRTGRKQGVYVMNGVACSHKYPFN